MLSASTSLTLLDGLRDLKNDVAWRRFCDRYRPVLVGFGARLGLDPDGAEDAAQRTLLKFVESYKAGKYDRDNGRLRSWLFGIARHVVSDLFAERARQPVGAGQPDSSRDALAMVRDDGLLSKCWEEQWGAAVLAECFERARERFSPRDIAIFQMLTLSERPVEEVAADAQVSRDAIYVIKHRILEYMRSIRIQVESDW